MPKVLKALEPEDMAAHAMSRFQDVLRKSKSTPITIAARVRFPVDRELVSKQLRLAEQLRALGVKVKALR